MRETLKKTIVLDLWSNHYCSICCGGDPIFIFRL